MDIDALPYVPATYQGLRPAGTAPNLIVLHSGETNEGSTAAEGMANFFARPAPRPNPNDVGSAHICVDNDSVVRCAPDEHRTNGAGGVNNFALHLEQAGRAGQLAEEWADPYSRAVIALTAEVCRAWLAKFGWIRPVFLDAAALARGERDGITTHAEVSQVFAGNDGHWDPGPEYPIDALLALVRGAPTETPEPEANDMFIFWMPDRGAFLFVGGLCLRRFIDAPGSTRGPYGMSQSGLDWHNGHESRKHAEWIFCDEPEFLTLDATATAQGL